AMLGLGGARLSPAAARASAAVEAAGDPGRRGLVAIWNTWMAMRLRDRLPQAVFDRLVEPWTSVVGQLPEA
ncbi:MAG: hypothetical protein WCK58_14670, partial [Chloroflexota bacterium]